VFAAVCDGDGAMMMFLSNNIQWIKVVHVFAAFAWMAGMLYLPRLFVYHTETTPGTAEYARFVTMEQKLLRAIINPSMIVVWIFGLTLAIVTGAYQDTWLQVKFSLVVAMTGIHGAFTAWFKAFARGENRHSARFFRLWNEIPAILLLGILIMVLVQPFD
jgi:putative membrane protein